MISRIGHRRGRPADGMNSTMTFHSASSGRFRKGGVRGCADYRWSRYKGVVQTGVDTHLETHLNLAIHHCRVFQGDNFRAI